jgi:3'-phosphoadenosine 5'-phosphosulfate sulfotransferase (PAPS reductase)/FAD synthetase
MINNLLITLSGGLSSAYMLFLIHNNKAYNDYNKLIVFANTGKEKNETLDFVKDISDNWGYKVFWVEADINMQKGGGTSYQITDFYNADRNGYIFENVIKKYGLPSKLYRHCTRELKEVPIHKFAKDCFQNNYKTALGIRADETHRIGNKKDVIYPLVDFKIDLKTIYSFWEKQNFKLHLKDYEGNCDLCFLKSKRKRLTILKENPLIAEWWSKMETRYGSSKQNIFDVRGDNTVCDLLNESNSNFIKSYDKKDVIKNNLTLFSQEYDLEYSCLCP